MSKKSSKRAEPTERSFISSVIANLASRGICELFRFWLEGLWPSAWPA
jgi:hypothetical protein